MTAETIRYRLGGMSGGLRLLTGRACGEAHPSFPRMVCDLTIGHGPSPHEARWWSEFGYPLRRMWARRVRVNRHAQVPHSAPWRDR